MTAHVGDILGDVLLAEPPRTQVLINQRHVTKDVADMCRHDRRLFGCWQ